MVEQFDVIVVGGASAGFAAAVAAASAGAERVLVLEKGPLELIGGNCRYSAMGFRFTHDGADDILSMLSGSLRAEAGDVEIAPYTAETFRQDIANVTQNRMDGELADVLVQDSREAIDWMTDLGHQWEFFHTKTNVNGRSRYNPGQVLTPLGGGSGLIERWMRIAQEHGVELRCSSRVSALLGDHNRVTGVLVDGPDGRAEIHAGAVVLASGGFQASSEKRARYLRGNADLMRVRGSRHNTGEVLEAAVALGAATSGQWQGAHASPIDAAAPAFESENSVNRYAYPYGISVNSEGRRFFDEGERHRSYTYAKTGWAVLEQPGAVAFQIFDQHSLQYLTPGYTRAQPVQAETIAELAEKLGIDADALQATIADYNDAVDESVPFDGAREDGRGTVGLSPRHSNWAHRIEQGPYAAYAVTCGITFSFGGLRATRDGQVVNTVGDPIKGLYANGDIVGMFYHNYPSFSGMTRNAVFGGRAGIAAAEEAGR